MQQDAASRQPPEAVAAAQRKDADMDRRVDRRMGDADRRQPPGTQPGVAAEFDLDAAHFMVVAGDESAEGVLGQFRLGDVCYQIVTRRNQGGDAPDDDPFELLTSREQQIVRLVCFGQVNKQIAYRLRISEYTVKTYLKQIFMKLNVHSRAAMVFRCAKWVGVPQDAWLTSPCTGRRSPTGSPR